MQTWADWRNVSFVFMYDWLLGMLANILSPTEGPPSITFNIAWYQILCVALLGFALFLTTVVRLAWHLLVYCCQGKMHHIRLCAYALSLCFASWSIVTACLIVCCLGEQDPPNSLHSHKKCLIKGVHQQELHSAARRCTLITNAARCEH